MGGVEGTAMTETTKLDSNRARASEKRCLVAARRLASEEIIEYFCSYFDNNSEIGCKLKEV